MKPCKHCGAGFQPVGRQLYCKPEHKRAFEVRAKRQWRSLVRGVRTWVTAEDASESRAPRKARYRQLADVIDDHILMSRLIFPNEAYAKRRHKFEPEDVSDWPAISAPRVWMLNGRRIKQLDQESHGVLIAAVTADLSEQNYSGRSSTPDQLPGCDHWITGIAPVKDCENCERRIAGERGRKHHGGVFLHIDAIDDYKVADWPEVVSE